MKHPSVEDFLGMRVPNLYVWFGTIQCYMRKGRVYIQNEGVFTGLTIANIKNTKCPENMEVDPNRKPTGLFRKFEQHVFELAIAHGYDGVYVEQVLNDFLPDVLTRYGYRRVNIRGTEGSFQEHNYWRSVKE